MYAGRRSFSNTFHSDIGSHRCPRPCRPAAFAFGSSRRWLRFVHQLPAPALGFSYALLLTVVLTLAPYRDQTFIYFQF